MLDKPQLMDLVDDVRHAASQWSARDDPDRKHFDRMMEMRQFEIHTERC